MRKSTDRTGRGVVCAPAASCAAARRGTAADTADPANDVMNSTISEFVLESARKPSCRNTSAIDSKVFGRDSALRHRADRCAFRFTGRGPGYPLGALDARAGTRP